MFNQNGVMQLIENPHGEQGIASGRKKLMVHLPTGEVVSSYSAPERILRGLGWISTMVVTLTSSNTIGIPRLT